MAGVPIALVGVLLVAVVARLAGLGLVGASLWDVLGAVATGTLGACLAALGAALAVLPSRPRLVGVVRSLSLVLYFSCAPLAVVGMLADVLLGLLFCLAGTVVPTVALRLLERGRAA